MKQNVHAGISFNIWSVFAGVGVDLYKNCRAWTNWAWQTVATQNIAELEKLEWKVEWMIITMITSSAVIL